MSIASKASKFQKPSTDSSPRIEHQVQKPSSAPFEPLLRDKRKQLTPAQIDEIVQLRGQKSPKDIATMFGVSLATVHRVNNDGSQSPNSRVEARLKTVEDKMLDIHRELVLLRNEFARVFKDVWSP